jgi:hypothetical protein
MKFLSKFVVIALVLLSGHLYSMLNMYGVICLPFPYLQRGRVESCNLIVQGGYRVYNCTKDADKIAVVGPVNPCFLIVIASEKNTIIFHKHYTNSMKSLVEVTKANLDCSSPQSLYARVYSVYDPVAWDVGKFASLHDGHTHWEELDRIISALAEDLKIPLGQITGGLYCLPKMGFDRWKQSNEDDWQYVNVHIAVKPSNLFGKQGQKREIQLFSVDPIAVDCLNVASRQALVSFDPSTNTEIRLALGNVPTKIARDHYNTCLTKNLDNFYKTHFNKTCFEYIKQCDSWSYDTQPFYPID